MDVVSPESPTDVFIVQLNSAASDVAGRGVPTVLCPNCHTLVKVPTNFTLNRCCNCSVYLQAAEVCAVETPISAPLPPKDGKAVGFISSFFKKKRQINFFRRSPKYEQKLAPSPSGLTEQSSEEEHQATNFGLACVFPYEELKKATNGFHKSQELGGGGFGRVYLGKLTDGRTVKALKGYNSNRMEEFYKVVNSHSTFCHQNLVTLYGWPDQRSRELLLVYELLPNGTLADHLLGKHVAKGALNLDVRIQIAIDTAQALAYLHSFYPPVVHGRVKTDTILLDNNFSAKIVDLGLCHLLPSENEQQRKLSAKRDVYSFGVVLMELISANQAVDINRLCDDIHVTSIDKKLKQLVDKKLGYKANSEISRSVSTLAQLSFRCFQPNENNRPHMKEVLSILEGIKEQQNNLNRTSTSINKKLIKEQQNNLNRTSTSIDKKLKHDNKLGYKAKSEISLSISTLAQLSFGYFQPNENYRTHMKEVRSMLEGIKVQQNNLNRTS